MRALAIPRKYGALPTCARATHLEIEQNLTPNTPRLSGTVTPYYPRMLLITITLERKVLAQKCWGRERSMRAFFLFEGRPGEERALVTPSESN